MGQVNSVASPGLLLAVSLILASMPPAVDELHVFLAGHSAAATSAIMGPHNLQIRVASYTCNSCQPTHHRSAPTNKFINEYNARLRLRGRLPPLS